MRFGEKIRDLRRAKNLGQRAMAQAVGTSFAYISKIENGKLDFGAYPSEGMIRELAKALGPDEDAFFILAEQIPEPIRRRVLQRPDAFRAFAACDDATLDELMVQIGQGPTPRKRAKRKVS